MSKQKRIKKLVKGHLTQKKADGVDKYAAGATRKARSEALDDMTNAQLITALGITNAGKPGLETINIDGDSKTFKEDFAPFDAREEVDTDKDNIGDNRDIIRTKVELDAIFKTLELGVGEAANGSLQDLLDRLAAAIVDLTACAGIADNAARAARYALLLAEAPAPLDGVQPEQTSQPSDLTKVGLAALKGLITADAAKAEVLKSEIAAMTATDGVTIDEPAPYNVADAAKDSKADAGNTDVATAIAGVDADVATAEGHIDTIEA